MAGHSCDYHRWIFFLSTFCFLSFGEENRRLESHTHLSFVRMGSGAPEETFEVQCKTEARVCQVLQSMAGETPAVGQVTRTKLEKWLRDISSTVKNQRQEHPSSQSVLICAYSVDGKNVSLELGDQDLSDKKLKPTLRALLRLESRLRAAIRRRR